MKLTEMLVQTSQRSSALHKQFLQMRQNGLQDARALIDQQLRSGWQAKGDRTNTAVEKPALFDSRQLDEFGSGQISRCLGTAFARYDGLRIPRIPNGELKMMTRVTAIAGDLRAPGQPASISVEYDSPADAWYYRDSAFPAVPYGVLMEIALQPCGFLSAYLDTYALVPHSEYYFRNLDGSARLLALPDLRGKTITTRARLLNSVVSGGTVIQKFAFELSSAGQIFYAGESTFGYFSPETMADQVGLDGGRRTAAAQSQQPNLAALDLRAMQMDNAARPYLRLSRRYLGLVDEIWAAPEGGRSGQGYTYARKKINPQDWFYPYHFYGDPVMPGSLGVEAMQEAMQGWALAAGLGGGLRSPYFAPAASAEPVTWRYRGQITQQHGLMELEVHVTRAETAPDGLAVFGDASLWVDGLRIYEVKNLGLGIYEAGR
jgi:3-hydroxymyristoyl/3-hydroxydecanoyl-(acyl carrier protein) dehydratase